MHMLAKRIYNVTPRDVRITVADEARVTLAMRSADFARETFQAEGIDGTGRRYRLVTEGEGEDETLLAGHETADGWTTVGTVTAVEPLA